MTLTRALALVLAVSAAAWASRAEAGPLYEQALSAYERVEYAEVIRLIERALPAEPLSPAELERAYYLLGSALIGDAQPERAGRAFQTLIALRPDYRPERDASPRVTTEIGKARVAVGQVAPKVLHDPVSRARDGEVAIVAEMPAAAVLAPAVEYRLAGDKAPSRLRVRCEAGRCQAKLPAATEAYRLGFLTPEGAFALATAEYRVAGADLIAGGSPKKTPVYKKWWLWTVVGVVVVGGVVGTAVGVTQAQKSAHAVDFTIRKDCGGTASCPLWSTP